MTTPKKWTVGIDPGFGATGAVLRLVDGMEVVEHIVWSNDHTSDWPILRAMSITIPMMETILAWVDEHEIESLEVCLETPFLNMRSPQTLMIQMSLFVLVQSHVYDYLVPIVPEVYLTIVHNATSKSKLAHNGKADKPAMIAASPWADYKNEGFTYNQAHTLADAYAHSLSAGTQQWALHEELQYMEEPSCASMQAEVEENEED